MVGLGTILIAGHGAWRALLAWRGRLERSAPAALGPDARLPVPVHREHRGLDDGRARPPAVARLRALCAPPTAPARPVHAGTTLFTLLGFCGLYFVLGLLFLFLVGREIAHGPERAGHGAPARARRSAAGPMTNPCHGRALVRDPGPAARGLRRARRLRLRRRRAAPLRGARPTPSGGRCSPPSDPFWDGNEVWLLAAGGVLFVAFPRVLAAGFSGFYLAIFLVLWC